MLRTAAILAIGCATLGCGSGSVDVVLVRPAAPEAQLEAAATVVLRAERADADDVILTATVKGDQVQFGDLPLGDYRAFSVELFGATGAAVGFGRAIAPLDVTVNGDREVRVPIRRPRTYLAGPAPGRVIEAPMDGRAGTLVRLDRGGAQVDVDAVTLPSASALVASAGADMFVASGGQIFRLDSSSDVFDRTPLADVGADIRDLAGALDGRALVAGSASGLHVIDIASGAVRTVTTGATVDAVATALGPDGAVLAVALIGAVRTPAGCAGAASKRVVAGLGDSETSGRTIDLPGGVADLAATPGRALAIAAGYCQDQVIVVDLAADRIWGTVPGVESPTAVAASDTQAWAVGSVPGMVSMAGTDDENVDRAAYHQLAVVDLTGAEVMGRTMELPGVAVTLNPVNVANTSLAQTARAKVATAAALSLSARGDQLLLSSNAVHRVQKVTVVDSIFGEIGVFPPMAVHSSHQYAISTSTGALELVISTRCKVCATDNAGPMLDYGESCGTTPREWGYPMWACAPSAGVLTVGGVDFEAGASAALNGRP